MEGRKTCILRVGVGLLLLDLVLGQTCERYWLLHEDTCYRNFADQVSYLEAKKQCTSARAQLVTNLTDSLEFHLLGPREQNETASYWCKTGSDDNDDLFSSPRLILERKKRSPSCCFIRNMEYRMGECDELRGYICEKDPIPRIHICLQNSTISSNVSDWEGARRYCQCNGGDLYSFNDTSEEENFLQVARKRNQSMWIGLRREADSNEFQWSDGTVYSKSTWRAGQLSTGDGNKLCVAYVVKNASWEAFDCNSKLTFMCKPSKNAFDVSYGEGTMETTPYELSSEESVTETDMYHISYTEDSEETTDIHDVFYHQNSTESTYGHSVSGEGSTLDTNGHSISGEGRTLDTNWPKLLEENRIIANETTLDITKAENFTSEIPLTYEPMENSTAETEYMSACSPAFENCYVAGVVVGIIILITAAAIAVAYLRLRKEKQKNEEAPVQLLYVNSYKEDIPAKLLAAKLKEVIA